MSAPGSCSWKRETTRPTVACSLRQGITTLTREAWMACADRELEAPDCSGPVIVGMVPRRGHDGRKGDRRACIARLPVCQGPGTRRLWARVQIS